MKLDLTDLGTGGNTDKIIREMTLGTEEIWYDNDSSEVRYRLNFKTGEKYERTIPLSMVSQYVKNHHTNSK